MRDLAKQNAMTREISYTDLKYPSLDLRRQGEVSHQQWRHADRPGRGETKRPLPPYRAPSPNPTKKICMRIQSFHCRIWGGLGRGRNKKRSLAQCPRDRFCV